MPKIELGYWDDETYKWVNRMSDREYDAYTVHAGTVPEDTWKHPQLVSLYLYVDEETGVVVSDIPKYERSLR